MPLALSAKTLYNHKVNFASLKDRPLTAQSIRPAAFLLVIGLMASACSQRAEPKAPVAIEQAGASSIRTLDPGEVPQLGLNVLMQQERNKQAQADLAALVHHQLERALILSKAGSTEGALEMVAGALLLLDQNAWVDSALNQQGQVLFFAAHQAAQAGNAGRSEALYTMAKTRLKDEALIVDSENHILALKDWNRDTVSQQPLIAAGAAARNALEAAMVNPNAQSYQLAQQKVLHWMTLGTQSTILDRGPQNSKERDEAIEAYRALRTGAPSLLALSLRHHDLISGLTSLQDAGLDRALPTRVESVVIAAVEGNETEAWRQIYGLYEGMRNEEDSEYSFQRNLAQAAVFQSALALYRSAPERIENSLQLAQSLNQLGLTEVATALLSQQATPAAAPQTIARAMQLFSEGLVHLADTGQIERARLSFREAIPLLKIAQQPAFVEHGSAAAAAYGLLGEIELHDGNSKEALPLLQSAIEHGAPPYLNLRVAQVQWQQGQRKEASASLNVASQLATATGNAFFEAEVEELRFLLEREQQPQIAKAALITALARGGVAASTRVSTPGALDGARLYARLLQYFDAPEELTFAYQEALELTQSQNQNAVVLTEMARASAIASNLELARFATKSALSLRLGDEALLYIALWQRLVEKSQEAVADGQVLEALTRTHSLQGWPQQLRHYALGHITDAEFLASAQGTIERTEAIFYIATLSNEDGAKLNKPQLLEVAQSSALSLQEVRIARELLFRQPLQIPERPSSTN